SPVPRTAREHLLLFARRGGGHAGLHVGLAHAGRQLHVTGRVALPALVLGGLVVVGADVLVGRGTTYERGQGEGGEERHRSSGLHVDLLVCRMQVGTDGEILADALAACMRVRRGRASALRDGSTSRHPAQREWSGRATTLFP